MTGLAHATASLLLRYPSAELFAASHDMRRALPLIRDKRVRRNIVTFLDWLASVDRGTVTEHYVATFDLQRQCSLYLTYYRHGDTRARGMALVGLKQTYRDAGHQPPETELPDYLPLMLEFAATDPARGKRVLVQCQAGLELLRRGLSACDSPYSHVVTAVCATLPSPGKHQRATITKLATEGPPTEEVGLEPFAPPEAVQETTR